MSAPRPKFKVQIDKVPLQTLEQIVPELANRNNGHDRDRMEADKKTATSSTSGTKTKRGP